MGLLTLTIPKNYVSTFYTAQVGFAAGFLACLNYSFAVRALRAANDPEWTMESQGVFDTMEKVPDLF